MLRAHVFDVQLVVHLRQFLARLAGSKARPGSIMLDNADGATRLWPRIVPGLPPTLSRTMLFAAVSCQACAAAPGAKFARVTVTGVAPDRTFATTMTVSAPSVARSAANTETSSALADEIARTLVSPNVERFPS